MAKGGPFKRPAATAGAATSILKCSLGSHPGRGTRHARPDIGTERGRYRQGMRGICGDRQVADPVDTSEAGHAPPG